MLLSKNISRFSKKLGPSSTSIALSFFSTYCGVFYSAKMFYSEGLSDGPAGFFGGKIT
jgi:hypothetical protein